MSPCGASADSDTHVNADYLLLESRWSAGPSQSIQQGGFGGTGAGHTEKPLPSLKGAERRNTMGEKRLHSFGV